MVSLEHEVQVSVYGCEVSLSCVCIYRCIHLQELDISGCRNVTDPGIMVLISHCNQLRRLRMRNLPHITGVCALCEDPEPILCFINMVYDILTAGSSLITKAHHWTIL